MAVVTVKSLNKLTMLVTSEQHGIVADEPHDAGDDLGMDPYELLLASLGACTAMTLRLYANRKEWPLEEVTIELSHERVHPDDCTDCEERPDGFVDVIRRYIVLKGPLTEEQKTRLGDIAAKCPVHKTLMNKPLILDETDLVVTAG
jgi:uncharacterized OsmC-like protein